MEIVIFIKGHLNGDFLVIILIFEDLNDSLFENI